MFRQQLSECEVLMNYAAIYLFDSHDNTFDQYSMKAFTSLKAYEYINDHLVQNLWANSEEKDMLWYLLQDTGTCH